MSNIHERKKSFITGAWHRFFNITTLAKFAAVCLALLSLSALAQSQVNVTLAWNPISSPLVAGFNIYCGGASGVYTNKINAGKNTSLTISNLTAGATYYFASTTYSAAGAESAPSTEVPYTVPSPSPSPGVQLAVTPARQFVLTVTGTAGQTNQIQATQDFKTWAVIGAVTVGTGGSATFTDTNAPNFARRFYRVK
jgi:hypothetical protein